MEEHRARVEGELAGVRVRPLDHARHPAGRDVAEAAAHLAGSEVADRLVRLLDVLERTLERKLVAGRDEERLAGVALAQQRRQPGEEAVDGRRLAVSLDERVERVVQRAGAVENGDGLGDARELPRVRVDAEAPRELRGERLRVGADDDRDLAGEQRRGHLLEVLDLGDRATIDRERLLAQDRGVHAAQERARLEAQLRDEQLAALAVGLERLRLPARAVEGEHQLGAQPLSQRMRVDERLELADELGVRTDRELRLGALLDERELELLEPRDLLPSERLVAELRQRLASPQRERLIEQLGAPRRLARPRGVDEAPDAGEIELLGVEPHEVAGRARLDHVRAERLPQLRDEVLQRRRRGRRRVALPQRLDEPVERDDPSCVEQEHREERALLRAAERDRVAAGAAGARSPGRAPPALPAALPATERASSGPRMANSTTARRL